MTGNSRMTGNSSMIVNSRITGKSSMTILVWNEIPKVVGGWVGRKGRTSASVHGKRNSDT